MKILLLDTSQRVRDAMGAGSLAEPRRTRDERPRLVVVNIRSRA